MAYISQASSPVADFSKCVISWLYRVPSDFVFGPQFLEFGDPTSFSVLSTSVAGSTILAEFDGAGAVVSINAVDQSAVKWSRNISVTGVSPVPDVWRRIIASCDFSSGASTTYDVGTDVLTVVSNDYRIWMSVDDVDHSATDFLWAGRGPDPGGGGTFTGPVGSTTPSFAGGTGLIGARVYPPLSVKISGTEFSLPCLAANADPSYNEKFEIADFMMWTGVNLNTSITANRRLFIDAAGNPVNPSVAIAALGTPVYDLRGPAANIGTNGGSAGNLTKTGTVTDFTPGP